MNTIEGINIYMITINILRIFHLQFSIVLNILNLELNFLKMQIYKNLFVYV